MKGLIVKDIELTKNQGKTLLILAVVIGVFLEISGIGSDFATAYITIIFSLFERFPMTNMKTGFRFFFPCR